MKGCRPLLKFEIDALIENSPIREKVLFLAGLNFGYRISEALSLKFGDFNDDQIYIKSSKGSDDQAFDIPKDYKAFLSELKKYYKYQGRRVDDNTFLFLSRQGENIAMSRAQASSIIKNICHELGIMGKVGIHSLRKSFVTKIWKLTGYNVIETIRYSRHKSINNLLYYIDSATDTPLINQLNWT